MDGWIDRKWKSKDNALTLYNSSYNSHVTFLFTIMLEATRFRVYDFIKEVAY